MKFRVFATLFVLAVVVFPVIGQEASGSSSKKKFKNESEYYYISVPVERVYNTNKGYVVSYRRGAFGMSEAYLPTEWFEGTAGKGEVIRQTSASFWPRLMVYYKDGEFSHVRLYVHRDFHHSTWGMLSNRESLDEKFEGVEEVKLEF
jgi:hypothetical protein